MADRLLLIDGHSVAYRAFFALPVENFATTTGQHTNAVFGFTSMLINVLRDEQPTHIGVALDVSRHTFRSEEYAEYKANRSKSPEEFQGQIPLIKDVCAALGIQTFEKEGFEADDIIATYALAAAANGAWAARAKTTFSISRIAGPRPASTCPRASTACGGLTRVLAR